MSAKPLLIINDIAGRLNLSPVTIAHWAYRRKPAPQGFPEPFKIGNRLRWRAEAIDAWLDGLQEVPAPKTADDAARRRRGRPRKGMQTPQRLQQEQGGAP
jgi:predicted DNA-binding transcriptional regulator AlpA